MTPWSPLLVSRYYKFFPPLPANCTSTIYFDANLEVRQDLRLLARRVRLRRAQRGLFDGQSAPPLFLFSLGRSFREEVAWLAEQNYTSSTGAAVIAQRYRQHLSETAWYGKVVIRHAHPNITCFQTQWWQLFLSSVRRDQVHINRAMATCGLRAVDLNPRPTVASTSPAQRNSHARRAARPAFRAREFTWFFQHRWGHRLPRAGSGAARSFTLRPTSTIFSEKTVLKPCCA